MDPNKTDTPDEYKGGQEAYDSNSDNQPDQGYDNTETYGGEGAYGEPEDRNE